MVESYKDILALPDRVEDTAQYIRSHILTGMALRRRRSASMTLHETERKLHSTVPSKRGEEHEWAQAMCESHGLITPDVALETADLVYYYSQSFAPRRDNLNYVLFLTLGAGWQRISDGFCIVKYETRMRAGDRADHKAIEDRVMRLHLQRLARRDAYFSQVYS
jgi:hypothetical protein